MTECRCKVKIYKGIGISRYLECRECKAQWWTPEKTPQEQLDRWYPKKPIPKQRDLFENEPTTEHGRSTRHTGNNR